MNHNPKRIFITGIGGFIGFHVALALSARGDLVFGCDHFNDYYDPKLKRARVRILTEKGISVSEYDIRERNLLEKEIEEKKATHLVHLAAQAGVRYSLTHPKSYLDNNLDGFLQILEVCRKYPYLKCTYASSSSVYGLNQKVPFSESDQTDSPTNFYGATKKANELMAHAYHHLFQISLTGLRYFTVYGPWGRPDMAYFSFAKAILENRPLRLFNGGVMQRDFTYIDDIVKGTLAAVDLEAPFEIFNLGGEEPREVMDLITILERCLGKKALLEKAPMENGDMLLTYADLTKAKKLLNFAPTTSLEQGVENFVHWFLEWEKV